jgi:hypothetical protein
MLPKNRSLRVQVDLLAGGYDGTSRSHPTQAVQDVRPRKARGCDLAFEMFAEVRLKGTLPHGVKTQLLFELLLLYRFW